MDYQTVSKIFGRSVLLEMAQKNRSGQFLDLLRNNYCAKDIEGKTIHSIYDDVYKVLQRKYKNEYVFKNEIAKKIVRKGRHFNDVSYVNEFRVNGCIADVAIFNHTSTAYEIKTELDSFERLPGQLSVYKDVFEYVYLVVPARNLDAALSVANGNTGIITLSEKNIFSYKKPAVSNLNELSRINMFNCLRPAEYIFLYEKITGVKAFGRAADIKEMSREVFQSLDIKRAHKEMLDLLTKRALENFERENFLEMPQSLLAALLNLRLSRKNLLTLRENMREIIC